MENIAADMLAKQGYGIFYFEKNGTSETEFHFLVW